MRTITFEYDDNPDFSWLEQDQYDPSKPGYDPTYPTRADMRAKRNAYDGDWYRDSANHVALGMIVRETCRTCDEPRVIDSLWGIDFLETSDDWTTGTFHYISDIPKRCRYLRSLAKDAGLRYRPRVKRTTA